MIFFVGGKKKRRIYKEDQDILIPNKVQSKHTINNLYTWKSSREMNKIINIIFIKPIYIFAHKELLILFASQLYALYV